MTKVLGDTHEDTLSAVDALGHAMQVCWRPDEAKHLYLRAVNGHKMRLGAKHLNTLLAMENLAMAYLELDIELNQAFDIIMEVLDQRKEKLGEEHPYTLLAMLNIARVKSALNEHQEAEEVIRKALPIAERNLGQNHSGILMGKTHLSQVLVRQKRYSEAESILADVVHRRRYMAQDSRLSNEHPGCQVLYHVVQCYQLQGKLDSALRACEELEDAVRLLRADGMRAYHALKQQAQDIRFELEAARRASR